MLLVYIWSALCVGFIVGAVYCASKQNDKIVFLEDKIKQMEKEKET